MEHQSLGRLILWFVMRSRSTALTRALAQIRGIRVFFEPFYTAAAYGPERRFKGFTAEVPEEQEATFSNIHAMLSSARGPVFVKDCASGMPLQQYSSLPHGYRHAFLIRDPLEICASIHRVIKVSPAKQRAFAANDLADLVGYQDMRQLFDYLSTSPRTAPLVLRSDELSDRPSEAVRRLCDFAGLRFTPQLLSWRSLKRFPPNWWVSRSDQLLNCLTPTYRDALGSGSFLKGAKPRDLTPSKLPTELADAAERMQDDYRYMATRSMKIEAEL